MLQNATSMWNENQQDFWQNSKMFLSCFQMNKAKKISKFQECSDQNFEPMCLKKANSETFSFWVDNIFAMKRLLFENCELMQSQQSSYQEG